MRTLVTGASGFVGSHVARVLVERGYEVHAMVRPGSECRHLSDIQGKVSFVEGDLLAPTSWQPVLTRVRPDVCYHLAWYVEPGKYLMARTNVAFLCGTLKLASELADGGCRRFVGIGTCFEYDTDWGYLSERTPTHPKSLYAASKLAVSLVLDHLAQGAGMAAVWARLFYQYGPYEDPRRLVPSVILALLRCEEAKITPGEQMRDLLHIEDVARAIVAIGESQLTGPVNVGSGQPVCVRDLVLQIGAIMNRRELIKVGAVPYAPGDPMFVCADTRRLRESTGWTPRFTLEEGLRETIAWWEREA